MTHAQHTYIRLLLFILCIFIVLTKVSVAKAATVLTCQLDNKIMESQAKIAGIASNTQALTTLALVDKFVNIIKDNGVKKTTRNLRWDLIEQSKGTYTWDVAHLGTGFADTITNKLPSDTVIFKLVYSAKWASSNPTHPRYWGSVPTDMDAWREFVRQAVKRYGYGEGGASKVKDWEIWNEPNVYEYWWGTKEEYVNLLNTTYDTIKATDSQSIVWGPALVLWPQVLVKTNNGYRIPIKGEAMYDKNQKLWDLFYLILDEGKFDGYSYHVYGSSQDAYDVTLAISNKLREYPKHANKRLLLSETNLKVGLPNWETDCPYGPEPQQANEDQKRQILQQRYACTFNAGADIVLWFPLQNRVNNNCPGGSLNDGVVTKELDSLPALASLKEVTEVIERRTYACSVPNSVTMAEACTQQGYRVTIVWNIIEAATQYVVAYDDDSSFWSDFNSNREYGEMVKWETTNKTSWYKEFQDNTQRYFAVRVGKSPLCTPDRSKYSTVLKTNAPICREEDLNRDNFINIEDYELLKRNFSFEKHVLFNKIVKYFNTGY